MDRGPGAFVRAFGISAGGKAGIPDWAHIEARKAVIDGRPSIFYQRLCKLCLLAELRGGHAAFLSEENGKVMVIGKPQVFRYFLYGKRRVKQHGLGKLEALCEIMPVRRDAEGFFKYVDCAGRG